MKLIELTKDDGRKVKFSISHIQYWQPQITRGSDLFLMGFVVGVLESPSEIHELIKKELEVK